MEWLTENLATLTGLILGIGVVWRYASLAVQRLDKLIKLMEEVEEVIIATQDALEDKKITLEEWRQIKKEALDVPKAIRGLLKGKVDNNDDKS